MASPKSSPNQASPTRDLSESVCALPGIGPKRAEQLANLGITTIRDLLMHLPRAYDDRRAFTPIADLQESESATVQAEIVSARTIRLRRRLSVAEVKLRDGSGECKAIWFGREFLARSFQPGMTGIFSGPIGTFRGLALKNPEYEILTGDEDDLLNTGRVVPIYRLTEGITQRMLRKFAAIALEADADLAETLPGHLLEKHGFPEMSHAIHHVHFPDEVDLARNARARFAYQELLGLQLGILAERAVRLSEATGIQHDAGGPLLKCLQDNIPFKLTAGQRSAVDDILRDMASPRPMMRLLQGDVGCGKTVVALHAMAAAAGSGYQVAIMAPTEILAEQHGLTLRPLLDPLGLRLDVLTGSTPGAAPLRAEIAAGKVDIVVGTHALIQESTAFHNLGLVVIDEQHRFGVLQREALQKKSLTPDVLHMTATPIPRTLAITVYGGMDVSVIQDLPPGRLPIKTKRITPAKVEDLHGWLCKRAAKGEQSYYVCPLVEESTSRDLAAVTALFEELSAGPFTGLRTGLIHGRLPAVEKEAVMQRFKNGGIDVLFSTTVIEVGVDAPNATAMVIADAAQFGLPQLHQLRGRVGRGKAQSHCFLLGKAKTKDGMQRLKIMCETTNGFEIAEADLELRGPGELQGVRQAGISDLRVADLIRDVRLLDAARRDAEDILAQDPTLQDPQHTGLRSAARRFGNGVPC